MDTTEALINPDAGFALIVNYLPPSYTDEDLHKMFSDVGPLYSAKIMRNKTTQTSFGYGFVNFVKKDDADKAIEVKDGQKVLHKTIRVAFSRRTDGPEDIKNANLFIGNIPLSWKEHELQQLFEKYGLVIKAKILLDQMTGVSRGCGFILYAKTAEADAAIGELNGQRLPGSDNPLVVKRNNAHEDTRPKMPSDHNNSSREVHVIHHYAPYRMPDYGYSGKTFVKNMFTMPPIPGIPSAPGPHQGSSPGSNTAQGGYTLFVYNIGPDCTELDLYHLFGPYGAVTKAHIQREPQTGKGKGFGFVTYAERECGVRAIASLNGLQWEKNDFRPLQVSFKKEK